MNMLFVRSISAVGSSSIVGNQAAFANALAAFNLKFTEREGDIPD